MADRPVLNPVLTLRVDPTPKPTTAGGKNRGSVKQDRLPKQRQILGAASRALIGSREQLPTYNGRTHLVARMFIDSLASTHAPNDLFSPNRGFRLVAPLRQGYLIEADVQKLEQLTQAIDHPINFKVEADISRVEELSAFTTEYKLRGASVEDLWNAAIEDGEGLRLFVLWLAPFKNHEAKTALLNQITEFSQKSLIQAIEPLPTTGPVDGRVAEPRGIVPERQSSIARAMRAYRASGAARATVGVSSIEQLNVILASGASYRIDPVRVLKGAQPGTGVHPDIPLDLTDAPIVGVIDGGLHAASYASAEAWRAPAFVPDAHANKTHGNGVSSLVVHGHAWNNNRVLPSLSCRIGTVQAVPANNSSFRFTDEALLDHLAQAFKDHPETRVWNISANYDGSFHPTEVSALGHGLTALARQYGVLPVISVGNKSTVSTLGPNSPADCEAALVVGGRLATTDGKPGAGCPSCLAGPGPDGMLKPDLSWFSELRMMGGVTDKGSSFATPLVSAVAAHTFAKLREPSADLVKALLLHAAELDAHDSQLGWGTPYQDVAPWECKDGSVTMVWRAQISSGNAYYWNDIPIPPEMKKDGKLIGQGRLTAVLTPQVSPTASPNYFATRLQTALQLPQGKDKKGNVKWGNLLGSMKESTLAELDARAELMKWQPVRRHAKKFSRIKVDGDSFRLFARLYTRDLYQFGIDHHSQVPPQNVSFVLTFWGPEGSDTIHNSTVQALGTFVESAVLNQEIEITR